MNSINKTLIKLSDKNLERRNKINERINRWKLDKFLQYSLSIINISVSIIMFFLSLYYSSILLFILTICISLFIVNISEHFFKE